MFLLWYFFHLLILINFSLTDQICIDKCQFEIDFNSTFSLPSACDITRREQCYVRTIFDYTKQTIEFYFSTEMNEYHLENNTNQTDNIIRTVLNLAAHTFMQHTVEYYCSTGDQCDLDYVENIALPTYRNKSCEKLRSQFIQYLNPNPPPINRECYINNTTTFKCEQPCEFIYNNPLEIFRSCDGQLQLAFETTIGQSTPINKPEYEYRNWSYSCTSSLCNGKSMQQRMEYFIYEDHSECLTSFHESNQTTPPVPAKSSLTFSKSFYSIICIIFVVFSSLTFINL